MPSGRKAAETVSLSEFAADWKVTVRTISNWLADGMPSRTVDGQRRIVRHEANAWKLAADVASVQRAAPGTEAEARARKIAAEARLAELDLEQQEGRMVTVDDAAEEVRAAYEQVRAQLITLPQRWAPALLACKTLPQMTTRLDEAVREAMAGLVEDA